MIARGDSLIESIEVSLRKPLGDICNGYTMSTAFLFVSDAVTWLVRDMPLLNGVPGKPSLKDLFASGLFKG